MGRLALKITCGDTVRYVSNVWLGQESGASTFVNFGHDDLFDQGIYPYQEPHKLPVRIEAVDMDEVNARLAQSG